MLWLKTLGAAFIVSGFGFYGLMGAKSISNRVEQIRNIRLAMGFLEKEISYLHTPLPLALKRAAQCTTEPAKSLFFDCGHTLQNRQGMTTPEAWAQSLEKMRAISDLKDEDLELLKMLSSQMGMSGTDEQKKLFLLVQEQLKIQEGKARREVESGHKIRAYGGFILGATVVLLLL
jgi:stage III sporulation protein AB